MSGTSSPRPALHERSNSQSNANSNANSNALAAIRLVPKTPPRLLGAGGRDEIYSRTPLPTHPSHFLGPGKSKGAALDDQFQRTTKAQYPPGSSGSSASTTHTTHHNAESVNSATSSPSLRPRVPAKKRLQVHKDNKTFSLLPVQDEPVSPLSSDDGTQSPTFSLPQYQFDSLSSYPSTREHRVNSIGLCVSDVPEGSSSVPQTPATIKSEASISADPINSSPWNYTLVNGLRKVPRTPDLKQKAVERAADSPLPPVPETKVSDGPAPPASVSTSHDLATKFSFQSTKTTETATTTSENTNYIVYGDPSASASEAVLVPSSSDSNYQLIGSPSPTGSVIYRPQTAPSEDENENYELYDNSSPLTSSELVRQTTKYSHESLVVPPLQPRARRPNENLGYYRSKSRESLRSGSLTSISTILSQQEAYQAIISSGSLIQLPILKAQHKLQRPLSLRKGQSSWAEPSHISPPRFPMQEHPHVWSSQLSTVPSESDGGTERGSRSWSEARRSSGFPSSQSRHSRQMLSMSSSLVAEEAALARSRTDSLEPPAAAFARNGRHLSQSSVRYVGDQDEYGDGITDMQDLRQRPSRSRLSNLYNSSSSDSRTNTMRSNTSSRANSLLAATIPTWARVYYGSGERRGIGAPGSSTEGTGSRVSSFRSGSPNTDNFPLSIYSPRRRPREGLAQQGARSRGSLEITPAPRLDSHGRIIQDMEPGQRGFRTWSMSSMWSPHLRHDRRATQRSAWVPPSVTWSTEGGAFGRRNIQVVMFIVGFIFPFGTYSSLLLLAKSFV
jgi:hypothetical protein